MKTASREPRRRPSGTERLEARVPSHLKRLFQRAANLQGVTLSDFLINNLRRVALETVHEHERLRLSQRDSIAFASVLLNPPAPNRRLKEAARRYVRLAAPR
ncbi:MAG: DUF1778 domain-containing protein [Verrucomicrobia bacterium]|nr:MAG: DUF1778 domain-containing protein [Verrucomicrobiota bacterium]